MKDVRIVPSFGGNIISESKFVDAGCLVTKQNGILKIFHQKTNKLFLEAPIKHGLAYLPDAQGITLPSTSKMNSPSTAMLARQYTSSNMKDLELLHQRLGHVNFQEAARLTGMKPPSKPIFCEPCVQGKSTRYPLGTPSAGVPPLNDSPRPGYLIHSDIVGPFRNATKNGKKYAVIFVDDFSRRIFLYLLPTKSAFLSCFSSFHATIRAQLAHLRVSEVIAFFKSDGDPSTYDTTAFKSLLSQYGIHPLYSPPYTQALNGVAERTVRTVVEMARTMMIQAGAPLSL